MKRILMCTKIVIISSQAVSKQQLALLLLLEEEEIEDKVDYLVGHEVVTTNCLSLLVQCIDQGLTKAEMSFKF